ncbi:MAG: histidine kinase [Eudoraea sp.]|nr:histidine kinase [Eudoraea sp.]
MKKKIFLGVSWQEALLVLGLYVFFALTYYVTLWLNRAGYDNPDDILFSLRLFLDSGGLQYFIFLLFTIPIWYLIFRTLKPLKIRRRLAVHLLTLPLFVYGTQQFYYFVSDSLGWGHLSGSGAVWDLYIPALFYLIQFGIFHAYEHYLENQKKLILEGELRQAAIRSELSALKAQLNPHFLYNVFNTINASVPPELESTREMIAQLSDLFRYQLKASRQELVPLKDELDFVSKYLELEKARFEERLKIVIDVPEHLLAEPVPPMLLQPLVENSVKHGLSDLIEGGTIKIKIFKEGEKLKFEISDTGIGVEDKTEAFAKGVGLSTTRERLQKMYQSSLELLDNDPRGLKIRFAI